MTIPKPSEPEGAMEASLSGQSILEISEKIGGDDVVQTVSGEVAATRFSLGTHEAEICPSSRFELILSLDSSGSLVTDVEGELFRSKIRTGSMTLMPPGLRHNHKFTGQTTNAALSIDKTLFHRVREIDPNLAPLDVMEPRAAWTHPKLQLLVEEQHRTLASGEAGWRVLAETLSLRIASELLSAFAEKFRKPGEPHPLTAAELEMLIDFIEAEMGENFDLTAMADVLGRNQFNFSRAFKLATGESPHQYVIQRRIMRIKQLLSDTPVSLASIAYQTGFSSQSHMTSTFSKHLGMPPGAYRKMLKA